MTHKNNNIIIIIDVGDVKQKKGAVAASGSGTIAKAKKAKASDVNKSIEQQMADALKEKTLSYKERQNLSKGDFALPGKGGGPEGKQGGSYPIPDESHARNALARVSQHGTPAEKEKFRAAVRRKYPGIKVSEDVEIDDLTADQKKKRETSRERTHSGHKSYRQAHDAGRGQKKPDRNVRKYWEKPSSMRAGPKGKLPEDVEVDEAEMMQLKHKKSGQIMRVANKVYQKQAHIHRKRGWVPDSAQPYMKGGSAIQHSYEPEGDEHLQEAEFKVKIKGLPAFYMPGKSEATIRQELRKNVKNPKQIVSIERTTSAARKKDFRGRSQAK